MQQAEAAERSAAQVQAQLEESGRRHAAAAASFEVCFVIKHAGARCFSLFGYARARRQACCTVCSWPELMQLKLAFAFTLQ